MKNFGIEDNEGIIRPLRRKGDPEIARDVMVVLVRYDIEFLLKSHRDDLVDRIDMGPFNLYRFKCGPTSTLSVAGPFLGAPQAVMGCERLISLGAKRIWVFGWCGSIHPDLRIGDLMIPTGAISEEGTSKHYPIDEETLTTDQGLNGILEDRLRERGLPFQRGSVWTTDAPFRETPEKVKAFQKQGVMAVEMELSALMTLSVFRSVRMSGLLVVSDELFELKWQPGFSRPQFSDTLEKARAFYYDFVKSMAQ